MTWVDGVVVDITLCDAILGAVFIVFAPGTNLTCEAISWFIFCVGAKGFIGVGFSTGCIVSKALLFFGTGISSFFIG